MTKTNLENVLLPVIMVIVYNFKLGFLLSSNDCKKGKMYKK